MTGRISSNGYTILKAMDKPMRFERALEFNQNMFYALIRRGFIKLALGTESFSRTKEGETLMDMYERGNPEDLKVQNNSPAREQRVSEKLSGKPLPKKRPGRQAKKPVAIPAVA